MIQVIEGFSTFFRHGEYFCHFLAFRRYFGHFLCFMGVSSFSRCRVCFGHFFCLSGGILVIYQTYRGTLVLFK